MPDVEEETGGADAGGESEKEGGDMETDEDVDQSPARPSFSHDHDMVYTISRDVEHQGDSSTGQYTCILHFLQNVTSLFEQRQKMTIHRRLRHRKEKHLGAHRRVLLGSE